jgi:hypothetical protein
MVWTGPGDDGDGLGDHRSSHRLLVHHRWIANSVDPAPAPCLTISKIDTQTLKEEGRYIVRPDQGGSPSRTSVNLTGDVAVANRSGGVAKVYAREESCVESNGMPGIQTSKDANFLPWGVEECVAWYTPMNYVSQRPVAWTAGTFNETPARGRTEGVDLGQQRAKRHGRRHPPQRPDRRDRGHGPGRRGRPDYYGHLRGRGRRQGQLLGLELGSSRWCSSTGRRLSTRLADGRPATA